MAGARREVVRAVAPFGLAVLLAPLVLLTYHNYLVAYTPIVFGDADWYATAWPALWGDEPLYPREVLGPHLTARPPRFNLPPSTALFAPLALDRGVWGTAMLGSLLGGLVIIWPRIGLAWTVMLAAGLAIWLPMQSAVTWANLNSFIFLMLAVAIRWPRAAPSAVGFAIAAKFVPLFLLAWVLARYGWRGGAIALGIPLTATAVVIGLTSPLVVGEFLLVRFNEIHSPTWSLTDVLNFPAWVGYAAGSALAILSWRLRSFTVGLLACLVAVPALHVHYWIWLLVPMLALWPRGLTQGAGSSPAQPCE